MAAAFVQGKGNVTLAGDSIQVTFDTAVTAGNVLVGFLYHADTANTLAISDTVNGSWSASIRTQFRPSNDRRMEGFMFENSGSGTPTFTGTATPGSSTVLAILVAEFSGVPTSSVLSQQNSANGTSATPDSGNVTPAAGFEMFVGAAFDDGTTWTAGADYSNLIHDNPTPGSQRLVMESRRHNGTDSADFSIASTQWAAMVFTLKEAGLVPDVGEDSPTVADAITPNLINMPKVFNKSWVKLGDLFVPDRRIAVPC